MGVEDFISNLKPKTRKLFDNIISILMIFTIVYGLLSFVIGEYIDKPISFFRDPAFINIFLLFIFLGLFYKILHGGKFHVPEQSKEKKELNIPNYWGNSSLKEGSTQNQQKTKLNMPNYWNPKTTKTVTKKSTVHNKKSKGSWICPNCDTINLNRKTCKKCRYNH